MPDEFTIIIHGSLDFGAYAAGNNWSYASVTLPPPAKNVVTIGNTIYEYEIIKPNSISGSKECGGTTINSDFTIKFTKK